MPILRSKRELLVLSAVVVGIVVLLVWSFWPNKPNFKLEPERVFSGASSSLQRTVIVPTLDSPLIESKSAIWCVSVQLAWNRLKDDLAQEPIKLRSGQEIADRLNKAPQSDADVAAGDFLAMAGRVQDGIEEKIKSALDAKFPGNTLPALVSFPTGVISFGYVKADVQYEYQFINSPEWLSFKGSDGRTVPVRAFGLPEDKRDPILGGCREQVRVLFREGGRFALDLSHLSKPNQVLLAKVPRKGTLAETLVELNEKLSGTKGSALPASATLLVPNVNWRIEHDFAELMGTDKEFLNAALPQHFLAKVFQFVDFKMDRYGSSVESGAYLASELLNGHDHEEDTNPDHYHFDRPFLIVMKKRDAKHPFFVMWVDNAELLCNR